ncbi:MAG TPA: carboxypeptidase-like regulatory domain-containing protein [Thermoanaerobaculia bacterium]|nr:carboxypeptidase-like regulatory domain-containing protein [Thermoanaerobaculia bacterium]
MNVRMRSLGFSLSLVFLASSLMAAVTGAVMSQDGAPIEGARVFAHAPESSSAEIERLRSAEPGRPPLATATTDSKGKFSLDVEEAGAVVDLVIVADGYATISQTAEQNQDLGALPLQKNPPTTLRVVSAGGPVANAVVSTGAFTGKTDEKGEIALPLPKSFMAPLRIFHPGFAPYTRAASRGSDIPKTLTLEQGITIKGTATDSAKRPIASATVRVDGIPMGVTGEDGSFNISRAPSNWKEVSAVEADRIGALTRKGGDQSYDLRLVKGATIQVSVTDARSRPLPQATLSLSEGGSRMGGMVLRFGPSSGGERWITDARGRATIGPVAPGTFSLDASHPGFSFTSNDVPLRAGESAARAFAGERLPAVAGLVVDEEGRPVPAAMVTSDANNLVMQMRRGSMAWSGPDGRFVLRGAPTGDEFRLKATRKGLPESESDPMRLAAGEQKSNVSIVIPRGITVTGRIVNRDGEPVANAEIRPAKAAAGPGSGMVMRRIMIAGGVDEEPARSGADGSFALQLARGRYDITFGGEAWAPKSLRGVDVSPGLEPMEVTLEEAVAVSGRVVRADGSGVPDVNVSAFMMGTFSNPQPSVTGPDGSFTVTGLPRGTVNLNATKLDDFIREMKTVEAPATNVLIELAPGGGVRGRVVEKGTKRPVADFQAGISGERGGRGMRIMGPPSLKSFRSDDGSFELQNVPVGSTEIVVVAPGFVTARVPGVTIEEGKVVEDLVIEVDAGTKVTGRVLGPDGSPVSGAMVNLQAESEMPMGMPFGAGSGSATSDANGEFSIPAVEEGERSFRVSKEGYVSDVQTVNVSGREIKIDFRLSAGQTVTGVVVSESGAPVADASVSAGTAASGASAKNARTDSNGVFRMEGVAPGRYTFRASHPSHVTGEMRDVDVASMGQVRITLGSGGTIRGRIIGLTEAELAAVNVWAEAGSSRGQASASSDGTFRMEGAPVGTVRVQARSFGVGSMKVSEPQTVEVAPGSESYVDLEFSSSGATLRGRVTRAGRPIEGVSVMLNSNDRTRPSQSSGRSDASGLYEVTGLQDGEYMVRAFDMRTLQTFEGTVTVAGAGTFDIEMRGGKISGRVVDASTSQPIENASVSVEPSTVQTTRMGALRTRTDAAGRFTVEITPGSYALRIEKQGYGHRAMDVQVPESGIPDLDVQLQPSAGVNLRVVDARDGRALRGFISVNDGAGRLAFEGSVSADTPEGSSIPLAPGGYMALVNVNGYAPALIRLTAPSALQTIAVSPGGTLHVESSSADRRLARIIDSSGQLVRRGSWQNDGNFVLQPGVTAYGQLAPGSYTLEILEGGGGADRESFTMLEGQTTVVRP